MTGTLDDWANAARLLVGGLRVTLLPAPLRRGRAGAGQFPQPGQLSLQLPGLLLQLQDPADAGQVQAVGGQCAYLLEWWGRGPPRSTGPGTRSRPPCREADVIGKTPPGSFEKSRARTGQVLRTPAGSCLG